MNIEKRGSVLKSADAGFAMTPRTLLAVSHYHQPPNIHPKGQVMRPGLHRVELVTAGRGWVDHESDWVEVTAGSLIWQGPGERTIGRSDFADPYRCLAVTYRMPPNTPRPVRRFSQWLDIEAVHAFTGEVVRRFVDDAFSRETLCEYLYSTFLYRAELSSLRTHHQPLPEPLQRALRMIEIEYGARITLAALANHAGWSAAHLNETCRLHLKQTLHQVLIARRLRAAREQLVGTDKPIKAIAHDCGFSHAAAFGGVFRTTFAMTPGDYRRKFQTGVIASWPAKEAR